jgi:hypothetical protein
VAVQVDKAGKNRLARYVDGFIGTAHIGAHRCDAIPFYEYIQAALFFSGRVHDLAAA